MKDFLFFAFCFKTFCYFCTEKYAEDRNLCYRNTAD